MNVTLQTTFTAASKAGRVAVWRNRQTHCRNQGKHANEDAGLLPGKQVLFGLVVEMGTQPVSPVLIQVPEEVSKAIEGLLCSLPASSPAADHIVPTEAAHATTSAL